MPPWRAIAIAIRDSVTVSIALEISGVRRLMLAGQAGAGVDLAGDDVGLARAAAGRRRRSGRAGRTCRGLLSDIRSGDLPVGATGPQSNCRTRPDLPSGAGVAGSVRRTPVTTILAVSIPSLTLIRARSPALHTIETKPSSSAGASSTISSTPAAAACDAARVSSWVPMPRRRHAGATSMVSSRPSVSAKAATPTTWPPIRATTPLAVSSYSTGVGPDGAGCPSADSARAQRAPRRASARWRSTSPGADPSSFSSTRRQQRRVHRPRRGPR